MIDITHQLCLQRAPAAWHLLLRQVLRYIVGGILEGSYQDGKSLLYTEEDDGERQIDTKKDDGEHQLYTRSCHDGERLLYTTEQVEV